MGDEAKQLLRVRLAVRLVLALAAAASVAGNVLHARPNPISQAISAWPPLALLIAIEVLSRAPSSTTRARAAARLGGTTSIALIAAWISYGHMAAVARHYGEVGAAPYLLPLSVDGLIAVASVCLLEVHTRLAQESAQRGEVAAQPVSRQDQVAQLAREGRQPKEIAAQLGISPRRVYQLRQKAAAVPE